MKNPKFQKIYHGQKHILLKIHSGYRVENTFKITLEPKNIKFGKVLIEI